MKETESMKEKGFKFFVCVKCKKQYPAKKENPKNLCLFCLQAPDIEPGYEHNEDQNIPDENIGDFPW